MYGAAGFTVLAGAAYLMGTNSGENAYDPNHSLMSGGGSYYHYQPPPP